MLAINWGVHLLIQLVRRCRETRKLGSATVSNPIYRYLKLWKWEKTAIFPISRQRLVIVLRIAISPYVFLLIPLFYTHYAFAVPCKKIVHSGLNYKNFKSKKADIQASFTDFNFNKDLLTWKNSSEDPIIQVLGRGYRAIVVLLSSGRVLKIARGSVKDAYKLLRESEINQELSEGYDRYGIRVDTILSTHPLGIFLEKEFINKKKNSFQSYKNQF